MRFSIVTISYNQSEYLGAAIHSVLDQRYDDLEYIIVDAGSNDGSMAIINGFSSRLSRIVHEPDNGPADGLNKGFQCAAGEIFGYLNADDIYLPGVFEEVSSVFSDHPEIDVICGGGYIIDRDGRRNRRIYSDPFDKRRYLYGGVTVLQQSTFFRREAFERAGGFNKANRTCWDGELMLTFARKNMKIKTVSRLWSGFRIHGTSISGTGRAFDQYRQELERFFIEEYGRRMNSFDRALSHIFRIQKWLLNPIALYYRAIGLIHWDERD